MPVPELLEALMELVGADEVDLLVLDQASPTARCHGLVEAVPVYEDLAGRFAHTQLAAALVFYETEWLRLVDLEMLAR